MFKSRQKVSHDAQYHKPSFRTWIRYTNEAKPVLMLAFVIMFGCVGYAMINGSSAASCSGANIPVSGLPETNATFHIYLNGADLGSQKTPDCLTSTGSYRLVFESSNNANYDFSFWRLYKDNTTVTSTQVTFSGSAYANSSIALGLKAKSSSKQPIVNIWPSNSRVTQNSALTINWVTSDAQSCTASGTWQGQSTPPAGKSANRTQDTATTGTKTYTLTCYNGQLSTTKSTTVTVVSAPSGNSPQEQPSSSPTSQPPVTSTPGTTTTSGSSSSSGSTGGSGSGSSSTKKPGTGPTATKPGASADSQAIPAAPVDTSDSTAPDAPTQFTAVADQATGFVSLSWLQATDNVGIGHYVLERSVDQTNWETVNDQLIDTVYSDNKVNFLTKYFYRVKAVDTNGNQSTYVTAEVTTTSFVANVTVTAGGTFSAADGWMTVKVPAGAVSKDALCAIRDDSVLPPVEKNYSLFAGPYALSCRAEDNTLIDSFSSPAVVTMQLEPSVGKQYNDRRFYTGTGGSWKQSKAQVKGDTVSFEVKDGLQIVGLGRKKSSIISLILKILVIILGIGACLGLVVGLLYLRYKRQQSALYDDYYKQQYGL